MGDSPSRLVKTDWYVLAALAAVWVFVVLLVDPRGDFPVLDDWSYARSVKILLEEGALTYDGWNAPTLFLQVFIGALFCLPFGFSFEALRISTLVAGLAGGLGTYLLLREVSAPWAVAALGSLVVLLNPSYLQHSFTFMTDVPFAAVSVFSALFYVRALRYGGARDLTVGTLLACCATLIRQPGVMIPLAYGIAVLLKKGVTKRALLHAGIPVTIAASVYVFYQLVIDYLGMTPVLHGAFIELASQTVATAGIGHLLIGVIRRVQTLIELIALMLLPLLLFLGGSLPKSGKPLAHSARRVVLLFLFLALLGWLRSFPPDIWFHVFEPINLAMSGQSEWGPFTFPSTLREAVTLAKFVSIGLLVYVILSIYDRATLKRERVPSVGYGYAVAAFGLSSAMLLLTPFLVGHFFERYLFPVLPFVSVALVALSQSERSMKIACRWRIAMMLSGMLTLAGIAILSIMNAHDHMLWNRVRWEAVDFLVKERNVSPAILDGGLSVNGWYLFPLPGALRTRYSNSPFEPPGWWRNDEAKYIVAIADSGRLEREIVKFRQSIDEHLEVIWRRELRGWFPGSRRGEMLVCTGSLCQRIFRPRDRRG